MATLSHNTIASAIYGASKGKKDAELKVFIDNVIKFLVRKKLLSKSSHILKKIEKLYNTEHGLLLVKVASAEKLPEEVKRDLSQALLQKYNAKQVFFTEKVNKDLIGGLKVEIDDEVIDLTIFNKLKKLQVYLTR